MYIIRRPFIYLLLFVGLFLSCGTKRGFSLRVNNSSSLKIGDTLTVLLKNPASIPVDSVGYFINQKSLPKANGKPVLISGLRLGVHDLKGVVYSAGKTDTVSKKVTILSNIPTKVYNLEIVNIYPHDIEAYTQGLEFKDDILYESTGLYGESSLRKVDYKTGKVISKVDLDKSFFGEGLTLVGDTIYQLTWQEKVGFIYNLNLKKTGTFYYEKSKEGWGICNDGEHIYKSDGSEKLWILNRKTHIEQDYLQLCSDKSILYKANELEFANGKIYANTYLKDGIMIINPNNGAVLGIIDCRELKPKVTQHDKLDVLNGIAYNPKTQTFFLTGKKWDKLFEVRFVENSLKTKKHARNRQDTR